MHSTLVKTCELPFIKCSGAAKSFWSVSPSGTYANDVIIGEKYAIEFVKYVSNSGATFLLARVVEDMKKVIEFGGIEIAFLQTLTGYAVSGAKQQL